MKSLLSCLIARIELVKDGHGANIFLKFSLVGKKKYHTPAPTHCLRKHVANSRDNQEKMFFVADTLN